MRQALMFFIALFLAASYRAEADVNINFDDQPGAELFGATNPLRDVYYDAGTNTGVKFSGPLGIGGMTIFTGEFATATGWSSPNLILWNTATTYANGEQAAGPETIRFFPHIQHFSIKLAGSPAAAGDTATLVFYDQVNAQVGEVVVALTSELTPVTFHASEISYVVISSSVQVLAADDLVASTTAPANDLCSNATVVTPGGYFGSTSAASLSVSPNCPGTVSSSNDVWFSYTAPSSGLVNINTGGSSFDTVLTVYSDCSFGSVLACNDESNGPNLLGLTQSEINLQVTQGSTYLIRLGGYLDANGRYRISIGAVNGIPRSTCAVTRDFPSIGSEGVNFGGVEGLPFSGPLDTGLFSSAARGDRIGQTFHFVDRPVASEAVLDLFILNGLQPGNFETWSVRVGGFEVGTFTINAGDFTGRHQYFFILGGQVSTVAIELVLVNEVPPDGGGVQFGYAGDRASHIELHGRAGADFTSIDAGWYDNNGTHNAANNNTFTGYGVDVPDTTNLNSFYVFYAGSVRGTRNGRLSLMVSDYDSPDPFEQFDVYSFEGDIETLQGDQAGAVGIYDDLQGGLLLGSLIVRSTDVGKVVSVELNGNLASLVDNAPEAVAFGLHLASRDHLDNLEISEYAVFGAGVVGDLHRLETFFCDAPQLGDIYAVTDGGHILKFDPAAAHVDYISPLGDASSDLEYNPTNDSLFAFEPGLQEVRGVDLFSLNQTTSSNAMHPFFAFAHSINRFFAATSEFGVTTLIYAFEPGNGSSQPTTIPPISGAIGGLAFDRETGGLFALEQGGTGRLYFIDTFHDQVTFIANTNRLAGSLAFGPNGSLYAGGAGPEAGTIYAIDKLTGVSLTAASHPFGSIMGMTQIRPPALDRRSFGDFNTTYCTDISDFLILLDQWQLVYPPLGAPIIGLNDFLSLLDNWQLGPSC